MCVWGERPESRDPQIRRVSEPADSGRSGRGGGGGAAIRGDSPDRGARGRDSSLRFGGLVGRARRAGGRAVGGGPGRGG